MGHRDGGELVALKGVSTNVDEGFGSGIITAEARIGKCTIVNALDLTRLADGHIGQPAATVEGEIRNLHNAVGEHDVRKVLTAVERALVDSLEVVVLCKGDGLQIVTHGEGVVVDGHHAGRDVHFGDVIGVVERTVTEGQNIRIVKELDLGQFTVLECTEADDLDPLGYR